MSPELHLFIIWANARFQRAKIIDDIDSHFSIVEVTDLKWDADNFSNNLTRFYGESLPDGSFKEIECGTDRFTLVIVLDNNPLYEKRKTTKGFSIVNTRVFDAKERYRQWTGGGHKIHATNNINETRHDLMLLSGISYSDYFTRVNEDSYVPILEGRSDRNLAGCIQWNSLAELFATLNETSEYVVLRNYRDMPERYCMDEHGDVDLLVRDRNQVRHLMNAKPVSNKRYRSHVKVNINNQTLRFDIRYVGDNYYDRRWQQQILENRVFYKGFYVPHREDYKYSLLYHALIHKPKVGSDYKEILLEQGVDTAGMMEQLKTYMEEREYEFVEPGDLSVYFNCKPLDLTPGVKRRLHESKTRSYDKLLSMISPEHQRRLRKIVSKIF
ncbi:MAG: hypothetical protein KDI68_03805 [Gammaproteobacteria bacterium]|nr:hypothetical protein [Gammaproteobacteria bacterium]